MLKAAATIGLAHTCTHRACHTYVLEDSTPPQDTIIIIIIKTPVHLRLLEDRDRIAHPVGHPSRVFPQWDVLSSPTAAEIGFARVLINNWAALGGVRFFK